MTHKLKLLFDECVSSPRLAKALREFYADASGECPAEIVLLQEKFKSGECDSVWLEKLQSDGDWIVITKDKGSSGGPKLPAICTKLGVTYVTLSKQLDHAGFEAQKQAFADVWPLLMLTPSLPRGTKVTLRYTNSTPKRADLYVNGKALRQATTG